MTTALILGAGASRGVSYAHVGECPSPLNYDFFDLLQRLGTTRRRDMNSKAISFVLRQLESLPTEFRYSMEQTFYTLQLRAYLTEKFSGHSPKISDQQVMAHFARAIQVVLRKAHSKNTCEYHTRILQSMHKADTILSFNYDLVAERALRPIAEHRRIPFARWIYGLEENVTGSDLPLLIKLHGSSNWILSGETVGIRTKNWQDFEKTPGYRGYEGTGSLFPIFLPFWDKRIEEEPWIILWKKAFLILSRVDQVIVWGYSLPSTDVKAQQLFAISLSNRNFKLCIIDPSQNTRQRWREMFPAAKYWEYSFIREFLSFPPRWVNVPALETEERR